VALVATLLEQLQQPLPLLLNPEYIRPYLIFEVCRDIITTFYKKPQY